MMFEMQLSVEASELRSYASQLDVDPGLSDYYEDTKSMCYHLAWCS